MHVAGIILSFISGLLNLIAGGVMIWLMQDKLWFTVGPAVVGVLMILTSLIWICAWKSLQLIILFKVIHSILTLLATVIVVSGFYYLLYIQAEIAVYFIFRTANFLDYGQQLGDLVVILESAAYLFSFIATCHAWTYTIQQDNTYAVPTLKTSLNP